MNSHFQLKPRVAIACGGTGGHLFPGLAVGEELLQRGCAVTLVISAKDVDQRAVNAASGMASLTLPAIGLTRGSEFAFLRAFIKSYRTAQHAFVRRPCRRLWRWVGSPAPR